MSELLPGEHLALTVAKTQLSRGENPPIATTTVLVLTIERLTGTGRGLLDYVDDPPECTPDDGEAQRIADTYADAAAELARDEAREARDD